ncbi:unnamed protein product [Rangifer tarandus platyrhynchus]|uniref:Uncharacterized protein n=1 Tax=Rangifer tarandus platyrhynchus TaxID=3082113 RepID=A0ABN8ZHL0_RANTA|nr:unnamed protein product [Rangifer tarandus platyrhynchus]
MLCPSPGGPWEAKRLGERVVEGRCPGLDWAHTPLWDAWVVCCCPRRKVTDRGDAWLFNDTHASRSLTARGRWEPKSGLRSGVRMWTEVLGLRRGFPASPLVCGRPSQDRSLSPAAQLAFLTHSPLRLLLTIDITAAEPESCAFCSKSNQPLAVKLLVSVACTLLSCSGDVPAEPGVGRWKQFQLWGRPACWGQTQPPVPPGAIGDRSPTFLPLCLSLLMWHHERRRARCYSALQSCAHSVLGEELAPRPGTCSTPSPARTVTPASPRDIHSMLLLARMLDTFVPSMPENQP